MSAKALKYAEEQLGVHAVHEDVQRLLSELDTTTSDLDKAQDARRTLDEQYADREVELVNEMRGVHPNMSDTRFKTEFKLWERGDDKLNNLRKKLVGVRSEVQGLEYDLDILKLRIKAGCSRMEELGGYLHYLAAVKQAATPAAPRQDPDDPWAPR